MAGTCDTFAKAKQPLLCLRSKTFKSKTGASVLVSSGTAPSPRLYSNGPPFPGPRGARNSYPGVPAPPTPGPPTPPRLLERDSRGMKFQSKSLATWAPTSWSNSSSGSLLSMTTPSPGLTLRMATREESLGSGPPLGSAQVRTRGGSREPPRYPSPLLSGAGGKLRRRPRPDRPGGSGAPEVPRQGGRVCESSVAGCHLVRGPGLRPEGPFGGWGFTVVVHG